MTVDPQTQHLSHRPRSRLQEVRVVFGTDHLAAGGRVEHLGGRAPGATVSSTASGTPVVGDSLVHEREHTPRPEPVCGSFDWSVYMKQQLWKCQTFFVAPNCSR